MKSEREDIMTETDLVTRDNVGNYAAMSKLMGVDNSTDDSESKTSMLARVKIIHSPIMGMKKIDGEDTETVVVKAGSYCIQMPDDIFVYGSKLRSDRLCRGICIKSMFNLQTWIH